MKQYGGYMPDTKKEVTSSVLLYFLGSYKICRGVPIYHQTSARSATLGE